MDVEQSASSTLEHVERALELLSISFNEIQNNKCSDPLLGVHWALLGCAKIELKNALVKLKAQKPPYIRPPRDLPAGNLTIINSFGDSYPLKDAKNE